MLGLAPRLPITITLLTAMTTNLLVRLRPLPVHRAGRVCLLSSPRKFSARPSHKNWRAERRFLGRASEAGGRPCQRYRLAEQEDRYRVHAANLARLASEENATTESGRRSGDAGLVRRGKWLGASGEAYRA